MSNRNRREPYASRRCPSCKKISFNFFGDKSLECSYCDRPGYKEIGFCNVCHLLSCEKCLNEHFVIGKKKLEIKGKQSKLECSFRCILISVLALILLGFSIICFKNLSGVISEQDPSPKHNLHSYFPSQETETWRHIFSVLDMKFPTVKSLILLHDKDDKTTQCLVSKLISMYTKNKNLRIEDISFETSSQGGKGYGEVLKYYRPIVEKHRIFVTDLNDIPGNIARIFHSLCDEVSSPIKPSLFIFILRDDVSVKHLKPSIRATTILKEVWQDLPSSELFPLLSRVVKNVIDVIPEEQIKC